MRFVLVALLAGCAFHARPATDDGRAGTAAVIDDTAADFQAGGTLDGAAIDPAGTLEPAAFVLGGLRARAYDGKHISGTTTGWTAIESEVATATPRGTAFEQLPASWMGGHPTGLGLTAATMPNDNFTVLYDGELLMPAGDHVLDIDGDDAAALEIADTFVLDAAGGVQSITLHADAETWMPIKLGVGESTGNAQLIARLDGVPLTAAQTRARVTGEQGLLTFVYYTGATNTVELGPVLDAPNVDYGMVAPPYDLPGVPAQYTVRFMGQLRIDRDGMYTLATVTGSADDSTELFIDGHLCSKTNGFPDPHPASCTLALTTGWHGIVVELNGSQKNLLGGPDPHAVTLATTIAGGDAAPVPLTPQMLRPAATSGKMSLAFSAQTGLADTTAAGGVTTIEVPPAVPTQPAGAVIDSALYGYVYHHATPTDYAVTLDMAGTMVSLPSTDPYLFVYGDETAAGQPVPTAADMWTLTFTDSVPGNAAGFGDPSAFALVELTTHGGPQMPFAPTWTYISGPRALAGQAASWSSLHVTGDLHGATLAISVRSAATAAALEAASWVDVADGDEPALAPNPYVQYRLVVAGDGWQYATIDKVELDYLTR